MRGCLGKYISMRCSVLGLTVMLAVVLVSAPHVAQGQGNNLIMMPSQSPSPASDVYVAGERLIISFRLAGNPEDYRVGVTFPPRDYAFAYDIRPKSGQNVLTYQLQLDENSVSYIFERFQNGEPFVYGRAFIRRGDATVLEKQFWVMSPARRWPDALRLVNRSEARQGQDVRVSLAMPDDRMGEVYYLALKRLSMLLPGGTTTISENLGRPVMITERQTEYTLPMKGGDGVYEVRLYGQDRFVRSIQRFQVVKPAPASDPGNPGAESTEPASGRINVSIPDWSEKNRVLHPGEEFTIELSEASFFDGKSGWLLLRKNASGRRPNGTPASAADRVLERHKVSRENLRVLVQVPTWDGEYRVDFEYATANGGGPDGIVQRTHVFSVVGGKVDAIVSPDSPEFTMGSIVSLSVRLGQRPFAAPVTVKPFRPGGKSSSGRIYESREMPVYDDTVLWDYNQMFSLYPEPVQKVFFDAAAWAPGRYEVRVILGEQDQDQTRTLASGFFDIVVPPAPGAIVSITADNGKDGDVEIVVDLPEWLQPADNAGIPALPYKPYVAVVRPRARTIGNALRFERILRTETLDPREIDQNGDVRVRIDPVFRTRDLEIWLLVDVGCFDEICPTAILDRKAFSVAGEAGAGIPAPDHIAEQLVFPVDNSINRPGRAFPDLIVDQE